ncbi:interferon-induced protein 44-like isoform X4 [Scomber scombrus]|uniref:Interferon-induced protein 44-like isoform X4 n=1 Tax=Scomber scombrus TaxID=13677 RepID=A0AAV1QND2_SCOSC
MEQINEQLGIPLNCIFPVKNYSEEINLNNNIDSLILTTLRDIIISGEEFMNNKMNQS